MAELFGAKMPDLGLTGTGVISNTITIGLLIFIIALIITVVIYLLYTWRLFNKKIIVFENVSGQGYQPTYKDRARLVSIGDGGEEILYLQKKKVFRSAYGRKMGKNTYWFAVGQDGYWYNVVLGDIDSKMGMLDIEPIDRDMRYMHVAVRKNITERYRKIKFMEKYGSLVINGMMIIIFLIGAYFLLDKMADVGSSINSGIQTTKEVMEINKKVLAALENVCAGGAGYSPVT